MSSRQRTAPRSPASDAYLQEQVRLLTEENRRLHALILSQRQNETLEANPNNVTDPPRSISSMRVTAGAITTPGIPKKNGKGCTCKGNCRTRVCRCVKKQLACSEFCRCSNALCHNQDPNKENNGETSNQAELTKEDEENIEKFSQLNLKDNKQLKRMKKSKREKQSKKEEYSTPEPSKKRFEKVGKERSIFSPEVDNVFDFDQEENENLSQRFGNDAAETETATNNDESNEMREEGSKKTKRPMRNAVKEKRSRPKLLQVPKETNKLRSNEEIAPQQIINGNKSTKRRSMSIDKMVGIPKTLGDLLSGLKPLRRQANSRRACVNNRVDDQIESDDESRMKTKTGAVKKGKNNVQVEIKNCIEDPIDSQQGPRRNNSENASKTGVMKKTTEKRKKNRRKLIKKQSTETSVENENNIQTVEELNNVENPMETESSDQLDYVISVKTENEEAMASKEEIVHEPSEYSETSSPFNISTRSDPGWQQNSLSPETNEDFNPMIPRRQLSRSPAQFLPNSGQLSESSASRSPINQQLNTTSKIIHDLSERPLPIPVQEEPDLEPQPPEELSKDIVDWERHKQLLVNCRKCHRTFHPHRINKHEKSCKRV